MNESIINIGKVTNEIIQLTALTSLKVVIKTNKSLRNERDALLLKSKTPYIVGLNQKINVQKREIDYLYNKLRGIKSIMMTVESEKAILIKNIIDNILNKSEYETVSG